MASAGGVLSSLIQAPPPVSGIDIVICFGVTDDVAMQRAAGRKGIRSYVCTLIRL